VRAYKYIGKWVCMSNTTIYILKYIKNETLNYKASTRIAI